MYLDRASVNGSEVYPFLGISGDRYYDGVDLTEKFANEIAAAPYSGNVWAWIKARIQTADYTGIHVNDYISFTTTNDITVQACIAGIDTYYKYGDHAVGHHIDFISRDLWPYAVKYNLQDYNNGYYPIEILSGDSETQSFILTRQMSDIRTVEIDEVYTDQYTYDFETSTITFEEPPATGTNNIFVMGEGSHFPWLTSNAYAYLNSLAMQVPDGTGANPPLTYVDYTQDGVWHYLPTELQDVIIEKHVLLPDRYDINQILDNDSGCAWTNIGKLWLPSEIEMTGFPVFGNSGYSAAGVIQYPIFLSYKQRIKQNSDAWWMLSTAANSTTDCICVCSNGSMDMMNASSEAGVPICFRIS